MNQIRFNGYEATQQLFDKMGFSPFGPGHSVKNGYEICINKAPARRLCFYDMRIFGPFGTTDNMRVNVIDYGEEFVSEKVFWNIYKKVKRTRYSIFDIAYGNIQDITAKEIDVFIQIANNLK